MKSIQPIAVVALAASLLVGCATLTPRQQFANVNDTFIAAVEVLNAAKADGVFDDHEWNQDILPLIELGNQLLDDYDAATQAGIEPVGILEQVQLIIQRLGPFLLRTQST